jgi:hypothetical protein
MFGKELTIHERLSRNLVGRDAVDLPTFLVVASWQDLQEGKDREEKLRKMQEIVHPADCIDDTDFSDTKHLFGFKIDKQGIRAMTALCAMTPSEVLIFDGKGSYSHVDDEFIKLLAVGMDDTVDNAALHAALNLLQDDDMAQHIRRDPKLELV